MPFHVRLLGKDRMALFSFMQSLNTSLGMSVFEQVAEILAAPHYVQVKRQYKGLGSKISAEAQERIQRLMADLETERAKPDKVAEIAEIQKVAQSPGFTEIGQSCVDFFVQAKDGREYYFDLTSAKPNKKEFRSLKEKLLTWVALRAAQDPTRNIVTGLGIPYNPYEPRPYDRWTLKGLFDFPNEIFVAADFWDLLGGDNSYSEVLDVFEKIGVELQPEIDAAFSRFRA